ncbi:MAG: hypothetical protein JO011_16830 [Ktedonobacteraceae bacterium]|nr:hypothetical protein [Ktedonobacteraceae bacterium]
MDTTTVPGSQTTTYMGTTTPIMDQQISEQNQSAGAPTVFRSTITTMATLFFHHSANYAGRAVRALPPVYPPEKVAKTMYSCAIRPQREVFVGNAGRMIGSLHGVAPALTEPMMARQIDTGHFKPESAPNTRGNLFDPMQSGDDVTDGWKGQEKTNTRRIATIVAGTLVPATAAAGFWLWMRQHND